MADFEFQEGELPPGDQVMISIRVEDVLLEGLRRFDTSQKIRKVLPNHGLVLRRSSKGLPADLAARAFPKRVYDLVDGVRTIAQIILEAHASDFNVTQVLCVMVQKNYLEIVKTAAAPAPRTKSRPADTPRSLMAAAKELIKSGDAEGALTILEKAGGAGARDPEINALIQVAEEYFIERAYRHYLPAKRIPVLRKPLEELTGYDLSPEEVYLVSRVNGSWDLRSIISISPLREVDALRAFKKLRERGIIDLIDAQAKTA